MFIFLSSASLLQHELAEPDLQQYTQTRMIKSKVKMAPTTPAMIKS